MKHKIFLLLFLLPSMVWAQRFTLSGYITDSESGESLIGANAVNLPTLEGTAANTFGFYSLTLKSDSVHVRFSYVGYQSQALKFLLTKDTTVSVRLQAMNQLNEVVVTADVPIEENTQMSRIDLPVAQIKSLPAL